MMLDLECISGLLHALKPTVVLTVADWADNNRVLTTESAAEPGKWRTSRTPYLKQILEDLSPTSPIQKVILSKGAQLGLALAIDTPIPTVSGWKTMEELQVGDVVFDENGKQCNVVLATDIMTDHQCYRLRFSDGSVIIADKHHRWEVWDDKKHETRKKVVLNTKQIAETHRYRDGKRSRYAIDVAKPLDLVDAKLPIPPYTFGLWLGDGNSHSNRITTHKDDAEEMLFYMKAEGTIASICEKHSLGNCTELVLWPVNTETCHRGHVYAETGRYERKHGKRVCAECARQSSKVSQYGFERDEIVNGFQFGTAIRELGVYKNKHIPTLYKRASFAQRLELLRGLMDTDGHITKDGYCEFYSVEKPLIDDVAELICSLGLKPVVSTKQSGGYKNVARGKTYGGNREMYRITFQAFSETPICHLDRKSSRQKAKNDCRWTETLRRRIVSVEPIESVPVKCISVDSPSHLYLCGKTMIPTHNTESGLNTVGCYMDIAPCPIMYVMPTVELAEAISKDRLDPMIENCPTLKAKVPEKGKNGGNTIQLKRFPGGQVTLAGANSASALRSRAIRVLVLDEVDAYPLDVEGEGSPVKLAEKRTSTFGDRRKIFMLSTPTIEGESVIEREVNETEIQRYFVPCPECGGYQDLKFDQLKWEEGNPESVRYLCEHCDALFEERHKTRILAEGKWQATQPENLKPTVRGYHINGLYSPLGWYSWKDAALEWEEAQKDASKLKTFVNTVLGQTFKEEGEAPAWERLYERREHYALNQPPNEVGLLTAGADVQRDRIEVEIVGWSEHKRSYSVDYRVLIGDTTQQPVWQQLKAMLNEVWTRADGSQLSIKMLAVDAGFNTQNVYDFIRDVGLNKAIPVKGLENLNQIVSTPRDVQIGRTGKKIPGIKLWMVGVSMVKSELYAWLRQTVLEDGSEPYGYCHFPQYDQRYFKGLTAEKVQYRITRGYRKPEWVKYYERNEPLDCRVYARAAATIVGLDRMTHEDWQKLLEIKVIETAPKPKPKRSDIDSFWGSRR